MRCRCPRCGTVTDSRLSTYGCIQCPDCSECYWIPREAFSSAPYCRVTVDGIRILEVYFDNLMGYRILAKGPSGQYVVGRRYDPFRGFWLGGDYYDDIQSAKANLNGSSRIGGVV